MPDRPSRPEGCDRQTTADAQDLLTVRQPSTASLGGNTGPLPPPPPAPVPPLAPLWATVCTPHDRSAAESLPAVPGYDVLEELGRGGMGVVYRARQVGLDRVVALKVLQTRGAPDPEERERFRREAEAVARLQHPNIVQVFEVGEHDGRPFLALELVPGGGLDRKISGTPLPVAEATRLAEVLARAVQAAHERGVLHRDLKPANVLLTEDGTPKVTDFGLAKRLDAPEGLTVSGVILGTPSYMAPEQAEGRVHALGPACDVYALGAILYEMLTGRPPFCAETLLATLEQVRQHEPVSPRSLQPRVPADVETICLKCLAKEPPRRYTSARELAEDLRRFLDGEPIKARPTSLWERGLKAARRHPALTALVAVSVLAAVLLLVVQAVNNRRITQEVAAKTIALGEKEGALTTARTEKANAEKALAQQRRTAYFQRVALAHRQLLAGQVGEAEELLDRCPIDLRGWEWHYLKRQCHLDVFTLPVLTPVRLSPDGRRLAAHEPDGSLVLRDLETRAQLWSLKRHGQQGRGFSLLTFSTDGKFLLWKEQVGEPTITGWWVKVADTATGREVGELSGHTGWISSAAVSPEGHRVATGSPDGTIRIWDLQTRRERVVLKGGSVNCVAFSPNGKYLAGGRGQDVTLWDAATGQPGLILSGHLAPVGCVAFSPDGRSRASGSTDRSSAARICIARNHRMSRFRPPGRTGRTTGSAGHPIASKRDFETASQTSGLPLP